MTAMAETSKLSILHFGVQAEHFCLELTYIKQVLPLMALKTMPNCADYIAGVLNLGGTAVTVVDFAMRVGMQRTANYTINTPLLLCAAGNQLIGIIVDNIFGIEEIERQAIQSRPEFEAEISYFQGAVPFSNDMAFLFSIPSICKDL